MSTTAEPVEGLPRGRECVLLVEDDEEVRSGLQGVLGRLGYAVGAVGTAEEAIATFVRQGRTPELLIADVVLPGASGFDLSKALRGERPQLRTLFISGYPREERNSHGHLQPTDSFLRKPFTMRAVAGLVRTILDAPAA